MSIETWQAEFMPTPARVAAQASLAEQLAWSLRKWTGGRFENLEKHGLFVVNPKKPHTLRTRGEAAFTDPHDLHVFSESACPLCFNFRSEVERYCDGCPLVETSDMLRCGLSASAYTQWFKKQDPEPMIIALGEALARETLRAERTAKDSAGQLIVVPAGMDVSEVVAVKTTGCDKSTVLYPDTDARGWPQYTIVKKKELGPDSYAYAKWSGPRPTDAVYFRTDGTFSNVDPVVWRDYSHHVASFSVWRAATHDEAMYRLRPPDTDQYTVAKSIQIVRDGEAYLTMNGVSGKLVAVTSRDGQRFDPSPNFGDGLRWTVVMKTSEDKLDATDFCDDQPVHVSKKDGGPKLWAEPRYMVYKNFRKRPGDNNIAYLKFTGPKDTAAMVVVSGKGSGKRGRTWGYYSNHEKWEEAPKELALARVRPAFAREYRVPCTECRERYINTWDGGAEVCVAVTAGRKNRDGGRRWIYEPSRCSKCGKTLRADEEKLLGPSRDRKIPLTRRSRTMKMNTTMKALDGTQARPEVTLVGEDGNTFAIMGACSKSARKAGWSDTQIEEMANEMQSGDYDHLLQVAQELFDVS